MNMYPLGSEVSKDVAVEPPRTIYKPNITISTLQLPDLKDVMPGDTITLVFEATVMGRTIPGEFEPRRGDLIDLRLDLAGVQELDDEAWEVDMEGNRMRKRAPGGAMMPPVGEQTP